MAPQAARWRVWGTTASVLVADPGAITVGRRLLERELGRMDRACSRFRGDSELSRVNRAGGRPVRVSDDFVRALEVALGAAAASGGAVDPTIGEAIRIWAADEPGGERLAAGCRVPARRVRASAAGRPDWRAVTLEADKRTVTVPDGTTLDLGATAKALTADLAARAIHAETGSGVLVNLGGDIAVAGEPPPGGWRIRAMDDHRGGPGDAGQTVAIRAGGLATSSTTVRRWRCRGTEVHHIIDPASGRAADGSWRTASVAAATCVDANTASTAAIVRGAAAPAWLSAHDLPARLVRHDGTVLTTCGWPC